MTPAPARTTTRGIRRPASTTAPSSLIAVSLIIAPLIVVVDAAAAAADDAFIPCFDEMNHPPLCHQSSSSLDNATITTAPLGSLQQQQQQLFDDDDDEYDLDVVNTLCFDLEDYYLQDMNITQHLDQLSQIPADDEDCELYRQVYPFCWWCKPNRTADYCTFESCEAPAEEGELTLDSDIIQATCDEMNTLYKNQGILPSTIEFCDRAEQANHVCPVYCNLPYLGADTVAQKRALVWMSRMGAILSFLGALYVLWDSLSKRKHRVTAYHQLLIGMACFDIVTAAAWSLATTPIPVDESNGIEGTMGNEMTCNVQAYFVQLGYTSIFYNVSLALYYVLVIAFSWREGALKRARIFLHGVPILVGFGLAFAGLFAGVYDWMEYGCHLLPPPSGDLWIVLVFSIIPICFSIASITAAMLVVYISVRRKSRAAKKWRLGFGESSVLEQRVFWQALFYTFSFYVTWPILLGVYAASVDFRKDSYAFSIIVAFVAPLQGFNNFLVYVRPRIIQWKAPKRATSVASILFLRRSANRPSQVSSTAQQSTTSERTVDPSVVIASSDRAVEPVARMKTRVESSEEKLSAINEANDSLSNPEDESSADPSVNVAVSNPAAENQPV